MPSRVAGAGAPLAMWKPAVRWTLCVRGGDVKGHIVGLAEPCWPPGRRIRPVAPPSLRYKLAATCRQVLGLDVGAPLADAAAPIHLTIAGYRGQAQQVIRAEFGNAGGGVFVGDGDITVRGRADFDGVHEVRVETWFSRQVIAVSKSGNYNHGTDGVQIKDRSISPARASSGGSAGRGT